MCSEELAAMRARIGALATERADLYHELAQLRARMNAMRSTVRITEENTRLLPIDFSVPTRAGAYLILRNQLKGSDMSKPVIYTVTERQTTVRNTPSEPLSRFTVVKLDPPEGDPSQPTIELRFHDEKTCTPYEPGRRFALVPVLDAPPVSEPAPEPTKTASVAPRTAEPSRGTSAAHVPKG